MAFADLIRPRLPEDIILGQPRVQLGGVEYVLPALPWEQSDAWEASITGELGALFAMLDEAGDNIGQIVARLQTEPAALLDALLAYDTGGLLPTREQILRTATKQEVLVAVMGVWRAANPLVDAGLEGLVSNAIPGILSGLSSMQPAPGAGPPPTPVEPKPSNGSLPTSTPPRSATKSPSASRSKRSASGRSSPTTRTPSVAGAHTGGARSAARPSPGPPSSTP